MRIRATAQLDTVTFSTWIQHGGAPLPDILGAGPIAHADVDRDELARELVQRQTVPATWVNPVERQVERQTRDVLAIMSRVLANPDHALHLPWGTPHSGTGNTVVGFARGHDGIVFTDQAEGVVMNVVDPIDLAQAAVALLPDMTPYGLKPFTLSHETLQQLQSLGPGSPREQVDRWATSHRLPADDLWAALLIAWSATTGGSIGACRYHRGSIIANLFGGNWFSGSSGAIAQRSVGGNEYAIEPAHTASLTRIAARCLDAVHHLHHQRNTDD